MSLNITNGGSSSGKLNSKSVVKFDLDGNKLEEFSSILQAGNSIKYYPSNISYAIISKVYYSKGFLWCYKKDYEKGFIPRWSHRENTHLPKEIYQYDIEGNIINKFSSCQEAGRILNVKGNSISSNLQKGRKKYKDYIFSYVKSK